MLEYSSRKSMKKWRGTSQVGLLPCNNQTPSNPPFNGSWRELHGFQCWRSCKSDFGHHPQRSFSWSMCDLKCGSFAESLCGMFQPNKTTWTYLAYLADTWSGMSVTWTYLELDAHLGCHGRRRKVRAQRPTRPSTGPTRCRSRSGPPGLGGLGRCLGT